MRQLDRTQASRIVSGLPTNGELSVNAAPFSLSIRGHSTVRSRAACAPARIRTSDQGNRGPARRSDCRLLALLDRFQRLVQERRSAPGVTTAGRRLISFRRRKTREYLPPQLEPPLLAALSVYSPFAETVTS
jgi:hypothetical protein